MGFRNMVTMTLYARQQGRHRCIEQSFVGEAEGGMIWERNIETYILSNVKQIASPGLMHETGCSGPEHWDDPQGWDGEGGGRWVQNGEYMYTHGWFMWIYGKTQEPLIKIFKRVYSNSNFIITMRSVKLLKNKQLIPKELCFLFWTQVN